MITPVSAGRAAAPRTRRADPASPGAPGVLRLGAHGRRRRGGEVQKEVIDATLADDFGLDVAFSETTTIYIERPVGTGAAVEHADKDLNPFLATIGLRIDPAPIDSGAEFRLEVELGSMPLAFFKAVEDTVRETLRRGLHGWQITDCTVTMTYSGSWPRNGAHGFDKSVSSTGADFRGLTPRALMAASEFDSYQPVRTALPNRPRRGCSSESPMSQNIGGHRPTNSARRSALPRSS
jgi:hypothetical protein